MVSNRSDLVSLPVSVSTVRVDENIYRYIDREHTHHGVPLALTSFNSVPRSYPEPTAGSTVIVRESRNEQHSLGHTPQSHLEWDLEVELDTLRPDSESVAAGSGSAGTSRGRHVRRGTGTAHCATGHR